MPSTMVRRFDVGHGHFCYSLSSIVPLATFLFPRSPSQAKYIGSWSSSRIDTRSSRPS